MVVGESDLGDGWALVGPAAAGTPVTVRVYGNGVEPYLAFLVGIRKLTRCAIDSR